MRIVEHYSHLNGLEFIKVHQPRLWDEIVRVIGGIDATRLRTKVSREVRMKGKMLYSPKALNIAFDEAFRNLGWNESRTSYWVTSDARLIRKTLLLPENVETGSRTFLICPSTSRCEPRKWLRSFRKSDAAPICGRSKSGTPALK